MGRRNCILGRLFFVFLVILVLASNFAYSATVHGTIYDKNANAISGVVVEVNSVPAQRHISKYGGYSFNLDSGNYTLKVYYSENSNSTLIATEDVSILKDSGDYIVDLFASDLANVTYVNINSSSSPSDSGSSGSLFALSSAIVVLAVLLVGLIIVLVLFWYFYTRSRSHHHKLEKVPGSDDDKDVSYTDLSVDEPEVEYKSSDDILKEKIVKFILENNNQISQKDIRKKISLSEAKISQLISDLEKEKKVKKIKKGRINLIVVSD